MYDLAGYRQLKGWSQEECASALGLQSKSYISRLESRVQHAPIRLALEIEERSGGLVDPLSLVSDDDRQLLSRFRARALAAAA